MKLVRFVWLISVIALQILSGCKKESDILTDKKDLSIIAGEVLSKEDFKYHVFDPKVVVEPVQKCYTSNGTVACGMVEGVYRADLDNNGKNDIAFSSAVYGSFDMIVESRIHLSRSYSICPVPIKKGGVISSNLEWVSHLTLFDSLAGNGISYKNRYDTKSEKSLWEEQSYMALRKIEGTDTTFGWIEMRIVDFNKINIFAYGYKNK